jgi:membrane-bound lytic murein transglycosylase B
VLPADFVRVILAVLRNAARPVLAAFAILVSLSVSGAALSLRPEIEAFIEEMASKHAYERSELRRLFAKVQPRPSIVRAMSAPSTARPWHEFRRRIVTDARIENGLRFWQENQPVLEKASREFGVAEEILVATVGIETNYGRTTGNFRVLDALTTLAFDYPPRADFFRSELEQYLLLSREDSIDPANTRGSYAGAIGLPQFLPSSYRKHAIDFDGDGRRDLVGSRADALGSIANYYRSYGWKAGNPVIAAAASGEAELAPLLAGGIKPHITVAELRSKGVVVSDAADEKAEVTVFSVETESGHRLYVGFNNFYVITRYNRSVNYAMAVWELASELKTMMQSR